ncbi:MAG: M50 family metallopeptidase [Bacteroidota bacterium]
MRNEIDQGLSKGDKTYFLLWGVAILTLIIWNLPFGGFLRYPFVLLGTWFHEMGHGLMALLLGGTFSKLEIFANGSGLAYTNAQGFWINDDIGRALVGLGGLLGPPIAGGIMIVSGRQKKWARICLLILAGMIFLSIGVWIRTVWGIIILSIIGLFVLYVSWKGSARSQQLLVQYLGLQASLSTFMQVFYLFTEKANVGGREGLSDTAMIAQHTFGNYFLWGCLITVITIAIIIYSFRLATKEKLWVERA